MTFLLFLYVQNLKGKDAFVYQLLSEAKFKVKLSAIDVRVDGCGNDDDGDDDLCDIDLDLMDEIGGGVHFSELDLATAIEKGAIVDLFLKLLFFRFLIFIIVVQAFKFNCNLSLTFIHLNFSYFDITWPNDESCKSFLKNPVRRINKMYCIVRKTLHSSIKFVV